MGIYTASEKRYETMRYNRVGNSGLKFPAVSLGFWHNFGSGGNYENMKELCRTAFDNGITQFDLANNYGPAYGSAEENVGRILREDFQPYRDELLIATKAGYDMWPGPYGNWGSRKYLIASVDQSLKRLGLEYVDIFYHHRMDTETPLEETMGALAQIVRSGKALYAGISNYDKEHTEKALAIMQELHCPCIVNQRRYSIFDRTIEEDGVKEACAKAGMGIIAFSPLAQGLLSDRYLYGIPEDSRIARDHRFLKKEALTSQRLEQIQKLNQLAGKRGQSLAEMALSWVLRDDGVCSVLIGASKPEQILENVKVVENLTFTDEELKEIDCICENESERNGYKYEN
ncbi:MAG TPA: aldo/keto reductase [Candidatus Limivivens intestinipullorum]|uniref:Aldo/keto reductase n=1 Tax=Candidatus Limivivens intestinipullorum TaxID=2840858 RepID=A0A9D1JJK1_9FIRM|nr:aldo/keto reductase [Candidatus Limivivens intestinipullorum]